MNREDTQMTKLLPPKTYKGFTIEPSVTGLGLRWIVRKNGERVANFARRTQALAFIDAQPGN
jgi:hypothetical protein